MSLGFLFYLLRSPALVFRHSPRQHDSPAHPAHPPRRWLVASLLGTAPVSAMVQPETIETTSRLHPVPGGKSPAPKGASYGRRLALVLVHGLAGLVAAQRCFAEEFGLGYGRVFSDGYEPFKGRRPEDVVREWLGGGDEGLSKLQHLFDDLAQHQLALVGALDGVAVEAIRFLEGGKNARKGWRRLWPFRPPQGELLRRQLAGDSALRHARVVLPGGAHGYVRARDAARNRQTMEE